MAEVTNGKVELSIDNEVIGEVTDVVVGTPDNPETAVEKKVDPKEHVKTLHGVALLDYLQGFHPTDTHVLMRDCLTHKQIAELGHMCQNDAQFKQRYKDIKAQALESYTHDYSPAKMIDIDRVATRIYGMLLKMIRVQQDEINQLHARLDRLDGGEQETPINGDAK